MLGIAGGAEQMVLGWFSGAWIIRWEGQMTRITQIIAAISMLSVTGCLDHLGHFGIFGDFYKAIE
jgi:hypothetical protein